MLFIINFIIIFLDNKSYNEVLQIFESITYDKRYPYLILNELNQKQKSRSNQHPIIYLYRSKEFKKYFFPLSGYSNINNLSCNENGQ